MLDQQHEFKDLKLSLLVFGTIMVYHGLIKAICFRLPNAAWCLSSFTSSASTNKKENHLSED